jgi:hypothetical protein
MPANVMAKPKAASACVPTERIQAGRFGKGRLGRVNTLREDYLELIADLLATEGVRQLNFGRHATIG